jgi:hypothetical protein
MPAIPRCGMGAIARMLSILLVAGCVGQIGESLDNGPPQSGTGGGGPGGSGVTGFGGDGTGPTGTAGAGSGTGGENPGTGGTVSAGTGGSGASTSSGAAGSGGTVDTGAAGNGVAGTGGALGTGGRGGSSAGTSGFGGRGGSTGGTIGTGGRGGATGAGGTTSTDGGTGSDGGTAATFTDIYTNILVPHCSGSSCHNPGSQKGVSFSSQSNAYSAVKSRVTAGNGANSSFYRTVNSGSMPPGGPKLSATDLAKIKAWIDAGALNN